MIIAVGSKTKNMNESVEIPVLYKNQELFFTMKLVVMGYVYKFQVEVDGQQFFFEKDDNGEYRAIAALSDDRDVKTPDTGLLKAIAAAIESTLK